MYHHVVMYNICSSTKYYTTRIHSSKIQVSTFFVPGKRCGYLVRCPRSLPRPLSSQQSYQPNLRFDLKLHSKGCERSFSMLQLMCSFRGFVFQFSSVPIKKGPKMLMTYVNFECHHCCSIRRYQEANRLFSNSWLVFLCSR